MSSNNHNTFSPVRATTRGVIPGEMPHFDDFLGSRHIERGSLSDGTLDLHEDDNLYTGGRTDEAYLRGLAQAAETELTVVGQASTQESSLDQDAARRFAIELETIARAPVQLDAMREYAKAHYTQEDVALAA
jgi:hypothetical protein